MGRDNFDAFHDFDDDCGDSCWGTETDLFPCTVWGINDDEDDISEIASKFHL